MSLTQVYALFSSILDIRETAEEEQITIPQAWENRLTASFGGTIPPVFRDRFLTGAGDVQTDAEALRASVDSTSCCK